MKLSQLALSYGFAGRLMLGDHRRVCRDGHIIGAGILDAPVRVMNHTRRRLPLRHGLSQRPIASRPLSFDPVPSPRPAREAIQNYRQEDELRP